MASTSTAPAHSRTKLTNAPFNSVRVKEEEEEEDDEEDDAIFVVVDDDDADAVEADIDVSRGIRRNAGKSKANVSRIDG